MIRLLVAFAAVQLADLAAYLQAPHLEANPAMDGLDPLVVAAIKMLAIAAAAALVAAAVAWSPRARATLEVVLICGIIVGAFGAGTAVGTLASPPRPAVDPAPIVVPATGQVMGAAGQAPTDRPRTPAATPPALPTLAADPDAARGSEGSPGPRSLRGYATWYATPGLVAAAGPVLRRRLGKGWRGDRVSVCAGRRCVAVRLVDWCACGPRHGRPTLLDLSDAAFRRLAPLSMGVVAVRVRLFRLPATDR